MGYHLLKLLKILRKDLFQQHISKHTFYNLRKWTLYRFEKRLFIYYNLGSRSIYACQFTSAILRDRKKIKNS